MPQIIVECRELVKNYDGHHVLRNINLTVNNGEFLTLLGPSGCGKTTLLRLIAGFDDPSQGMIKINGQDVSRLSPQERQVSMVFQSYALFPHMNVYENIAFGLRCKYLPENEINIRVSEVLEMVKLTELVKRKPSQLSGGQQQRVAIARAVVNKPLVLLLDEPLSSLDYRLRKMMQIELKQLQTQLGITFIFVTHDQEEALSLSDRIVVMREGMIEQIGSPREIYQNPENLHVAKFVGEANLFDAEIIKIDKNELIVNIENQEVILKNNNNFNIKDINAVKICVLIRPEDMRITRQSEMADATSTGMTTGMLSAKIEQIIYKGPIIELSLRLPSQKIISAAQFFNGKNDKLDYTRGETVWLRWTPGREIVLPAEGRFHEYKPLQGLINGKLSTLEQIDWSKEWKS